MDHHKRFYGGMHNNGYKEKRNPGGSRCIVRLSAALLCDIRGEKAMDGYFIFPNAGNAFIDAQLLHEGKYRIWGWSSGFGNRNLHGDGNLHSGSNCRTDHIGHLCGGFIGFKKGGRKEQNSFCAVSFGRTDFRNGITIELDNNIYQIIEFQHVKPGKGAAFVRTKLKNVKSGGVIEKTFRPTEKCPQARIDRKDMQYLYSDGDLFNFMDMENYEQIALNADAIGDTLKFVKENEMVKVCSHNGSVFAIEPPLFVELEITETEPGFKGDTATGASKPAVVETGATVYVPLFVNQGDVIKIDTRTGEYLSRV